MIPLFQYMIDGKHFNNFHYILSAVSFPRGLATMESGYCIPTEYIARGGCYLVATCEWRMAQHKHLRISVVPEAFSCQLRRNQALPEVFKVLRHSWKMWQWCRFDRTQC